LSGATGCEDDGTDSELEARVDGVDSSECRLRGCCGSDVGAADVRTGVSGACVTAVVGGAGASVVGGVGALVRLGGLATGAEASGADGFSTGGAACVLGADRVTGGEIGA